VAGLGVSLAGVGEIMGSSIYSGVMAAALAVSGATALTGYLRSTSPTEGE